MKANQEKLWQNTTKGLRACKNAMSDQGAQLRDLQYKVSQLKQILHDTKAVSDTLPHAELKDYLPFSSDSDVVTVLNDTNLLNALYSKVLFIYRML